MKNSIAVFIFGISSVLYSQTGVIRGTIVGSSNGAAAARAGTPLSGAPITYERVVIYEPKTSGLGARPKEGDPRFFGSATADGSGIHNIGGLPAGTYRVCARVPGQPYLDPCRWGTPPWALVRGGEVAKLDIALAKGVFLNIRINDPLHRLPANSAASRFDSPRLTVGIVVGKGGFLAAERIGVDADGEDYRIAVPVNVTMRLWLHNRYFTMSDSLGKPLGSGSEAATFQAVAGVDQTFVFNITGARSSPLP